MNNVRYTTWWREGTSVFVDVHETNKSKRLKVVGAGVLQHANPGQWPNGGGVCAGSDGLHFPDCIAFDNIANVYVFLSSSSFVLLSFLFFFFFVFQNYGRDGAGSLSGTVAGCVPAYASIHDLCCDLFILSFSPSFFINQRHWDTWDNIFFDDRTKTYISTMRANNLNASNPCRDFYPGCFTKRQPGCTLERCYKTRRVISRVQSAGPDISTMGADGGNVPIEFAADPDHQNYVQATFPYLNVYLGVLMVYEAASMRQNVRCKLAWSNDTITWHNIEPGSDLIPLGAEGTFESHICYGSIPVVRTSAEYLRDQRSPCHIKNQNLQE